MDSFLDFKNKGRLCVYEVEAEETNKCFIFLPGGSKVIGKDRFVNWQNSLVKEGISSISFDFSGVGKSSGVITDQSLSKRIGEAKYIAEYIVNKYPGIPIILYGVSMGGYVALGLINELPQVFSKLILQVPAAYSPKAYNLNFDNTFTKELHKVNSWNNSESFKWFEDYSGSCFFIAAESDQVIPREVIDSYKALGYKKDDFNFLQVPMAPHNLWKPRENRDLDLDRVYYEILNFVK